MIAKCGLELLSNATKNAVTVDSQSVIFCHTCCTNLKKKKYPKLSIANGMELDEIPDELLIATDLEQQLFARMLVFTKIVQLPNRTGKRMKGLTGKMINVPLEESDISNSIKALPRCLDDAAVVALQLKKKKEYKSAYAEAFIRPNVCIKAVEKLKELENPYYTNVQIDKDFMEREKQKIDESDEDTPNESGDDEANDNKNTELADVEMLNSVKKFQADHDENTCLIREDLESIIVENKTEKTINKKKGNGSVISIQPGENKVLTKSFQLYLLDISSKYVFFL